MQARTFARSCMFSASLACAVIWCQGDRGLLAAVPPPIDPQQVQDQDDMTWADYRPIPGVDWTDPKHKPERTIRIALVVADFEDQPFVITLPKHSRPVRQSANRSDPRANRSRSSIATFGTSRRRSIIVTPCMSIGWSCRTARSALNSTPMGRIACRSR